MLGLFGGLGYFFPLFFLGGGYRYGYRYCRRPIYYSRCYRPYRYRRYY